MTRRSHSGRAAPKSVSQSRLRELREKAERGVEAVPRSVKPVFGKAVQAARLAELRREKFENQPVTKPKKPRKKPSAEEAFAALRQEYLLSLTAKPTPLPRDPERERRQAAKDMQAALDAPISAARPAPVPAFSMIRGRV